MRFFIRRYLKSFIYAVVVIFIFSFIQKRAEFAENQKLLEIDHQFNPVDGQLHLPNGLDVDKKDTRKENVDEVRDTARRSNAAVADDNDEDEDYDEENDDDDDEEEEGEDEDEDLNEYAEGDIGPDPQELKRAIEPGHDTRQEDIKPQKMKPEVAPLEKEDNNLKYFFREREQIYRERQNHIQDVCNRLGSLGSYGSLELAPLRRLRWLNSKHLIMCFNAKVGTSTWTQYLMEAGYPGLLKNTSHWHYTAELRLKPPYKRGSYKSIKLMKEYAKIILVRDPFARIVSAYLDKIARMKFSKLGHFIVGKYRHENSELKQRHPSFEEFVHFLVDHTPRSDDIRQKRDHRSDRHWFHYYANCAPCDIHYDVIATMETVHEDTRYIMEKYELGLKDTVWNNHQAKSSSEEMAIKLFQDLPRNLTLELYQRYRVDFLMFGYGVEKYLST